MSNSTEPGSASVLSVRSEDGASAELIVHQAAQADAVLYWLPAMGVTARHYQAYGAALAEQGIDAVLHEWRGAGSSDRRAARDSDWGYRELLADIGAGLRAIREAQPGKAIYIGGHSLGAQLAALHFAGDPELAGLVIVGSGVPDWRHFPLWQRPLAVLVFVAFRAIGALVGHYPGKRIGFAGREARSVIHDWSASALSGAYRVRGVGDLEPLLARREGLVIGVRLADDSYVPIAAFEALLGKLPRAQIERHALDRSHFNSAVATHFSWLKDPRPVVDRIVSGTRRIAAC